MIAEEIEDLFNLDPGTFETNQRLYFIANKKLI